jgi:hypothetical protein
MKSSELMLHMNSAMDREELRIGASREVCNGSRRAQNQSFKWTSQWIVKGSELELLYDNVS